MDTSIKPRTSRFKVGEKVRIAGRTPYTGLVSGETGTIVKVWSFPDLGGYPYEALMDSLPDEGPYPFAASELEPA